MQHSESCNHLICKLKVHWRSYLNLQLLIGVGVVVLLIVLGSCLVGSMVATSEVKSVALKFAHEIKVTEDQARERQSVLSIRIDPASPGQNWSYCVIEQEQILRTETLPPEVSCNGQIVFNPDGVPLAPTTFNFRKGDHTVTVAVDLKGAVTFP